MACDNDSIWIKPSRGLIILGITLSLVLFAEVGVLNYHSSQFTPTIQTQVHADLRTAYWPESPIPRNDEGDPLADWIGLENYLSRATCPLSSKNQDAPKSTFTPQQLNKIKDLEDETVNLARQAQIIYTEFADVLTPEQQKLYFAPQESVGDSQAMGIDCSGQEQQIYCFYLLDKLAKSESGEVPKKSLPAPAPTDTANVLAPTRIMVSLTYLIGDPNYPLTSKQAKELLEIFTRLHTVLLEVHVNHAKIMSLLTSQQMEDASKLGIRRWEPFLSSAYLETLIGMIKQRQAGKPLEELVGTTEKKVKAFNPETDSKPPAPPPGKNPPPQNGTVASPAGQAAPSTPAAPSEATSK